MTYVPDWDSDTMREQALSFADAGYNITILYGVDKNGQCECGKEDCPNQFKHPRVNNWSNLPVQTYEQVESQFQHKVFGRSYGIILSDDDLVVDFDPRNNVNALDELNELLGFDIEEKSFFTVKTGSGGKHLYFKKPSDFSTVKNLSYLKGIDFLSKGSFVVGCGSAHKSGNVYEVLDYTKTDPHNISQSPVELLSLIEKKEVVRDSAYEPGSSDLDELRSALLSIPNDENTEYDFWLSIGMALAYETGGSDEGYQLWDEWSDRSSKYDSVGMDKKWDSFCSTKNVKNPVTAGTIFKHAFDNGWEQEFDIELDLSGYIKRLEEGKALKAVIKNSTEDFMELNELPERLQAVPGVLGEVLGYILDTAKYPLYMPSLNAALALCSVIIARDFTTDHDNYSSLYLISVAETGAGKEHPYKTVSKILYSASQASIVKGEVSGKAAIVTELYSNPRALFVKDEMAHWMQIIGSKSASENKMSEVKAWMELYSKCDSFFSSDSYTALSEIRKGKIDEMGESCITVEKPAVSLLGMTTPHKMSESITKMMIMDGFLNRFLLMFAQEGDQKMNRSAKSKPVPQSILAWIETIERRVLHENRSKNSQGRNAYNDPLKAVEIPFDNESYFLLDAFEDRILLKKKDLRKKGLELMVVRDQEKAMRIALIVELSKDPYSRTITRDSTEFAIQLVEFCSEQLIKYIEFNIVENTTDKRYKDAYIAIESSGSDGILKSELMTRSPFKSADGKVRNDILQYLVEQAQSVVQIGVKNGGRGRPSVKYVASRFIDWSKVENESEGNS